VNPYFCLGLNGRKALGGAELFENQAKVKTYFCLGLNGRKSARQSRAFFSERKPDSDRRRLGA
jgi:hypothetical protein